MVREAAGWWLGIPCRDIGVHFFLSKGFLLLLPSPSIHGRVLNNNNGLVVGHARIQLLPWMCLIGVEASKLLFKVHLCIKGIPHHTRQAATICQLLPQVSLLEAIDHDYHNDAEAHCCCVMV
jgi:hypothetical protein